MNLLSFFDYYWRF